jgi:hypothetical protein
VIAAGQVYVTFSEAVSPESVSGNITLSKSGGSAVSGTAAYYAESNRVVFTPGAALESGQEYVITVKTGVKDESGNPLAREFSARFVTADTVGPSITNVAFDGQTPSDDSRVVNAISATAEITANIGDASGLDYGQINLRLGPAQVRTKADFTAQDSYSGNRLTYRILPAIATGDCMVTIEAYDALGNIGSWWARVLVSPVASPTALAAGTRTFATPAQFRPGTDGNVTLVYTLTAPANIDVQVYGPEGRAVWGRRYAAGVAGGRVGYNTVAWDGRDTSGQYIGNGLYVYRIISGGRVLGTGYIIVLE